MKLRIYRGSGDVRRQRRPKRLAIVEIGGTPRIPRYLDRLDLPHVVVPIEVSGSQGHMGDEIWRRPDAR
jgi:hypothetical protein